MKYIYIVLYNVFGYIPKNGKLKEYIKKLYDKHQKERDQKIFMIQFRETNKNL